MSSVGSISFIWAWIRIRLTLFTMPPCPTMPTSGPIIAACVASIFAACVPTEKSEKADMLIVLTPPKMLRYEARAIMALLDAGADFIHLRKPGYSSDELQQFLKDIPVAYRGRLSVHYHHRVGREAGLGGLHESGRSEERRVGKEGRCGW